MNSKDHITKTDLIFESLLFCEKNHVILHQTEQNHMHNKDENWWNLQAAGYGKIHEDNVIS